LSDALHERLTERFVDRRTSVLMRRLRENTMLETEIAKSGEVVVEGHTIGRLGGFQFMADPAAGGPEAKALRSAAQKALAGEIDMRAARLANAADDQFVLASDAAVRWIGEPVGKLVAGDEVLAPRLRIIADEHLSGASREAVQARLDLWLKTHVEKLLAPLLALARAEDVTGMARGVAFQIVEALGVIERQRVAEDVKGLDQAARASVRKYGVRFGAYHVYLPALLKPAPRALAVQLWALKHGDGELKGLDEVRALASSGRTSFPVDKGVNKSLYRTVGYRVCGERAVRVDILERLADLIRPALAWRPGAAGERPAGAVEGGGFTVTPGMTSLTGSSGDDFASILRSLGYRMEMRPKPVESAPPPVEASPPAETLEVAAEAAPEDLEGDAAPEATSALEEVETVAEPSVAEPSVTEPSVSEPPTAELPELPVEDLSAPQPAPPETASREAPAPAGEQVAADPAPSTSASVDEPVAAETAPPPAQAAGEPAAEPVATEPVTIEVWRPGRMSERRERRPHRGPRKAEQGAGRPAAVAVAAAEPSPAEVPAEAAAAVPAAPAEAPRREDRRPRRDRPEQERGDRSDRGPRPDRGRERTRRERDRGDRGRRERDRDRPDRDPELRAAFIKGQGRKERRDREPDPDSPFAKLAALKEQLEANAKERR
jgi:ATP-dependent RNA helicase SUPV3L1/SUV3